MLLLAATDAARMERVFDGFFRRVLIPRYAQFLKPIHAAGKKVLFCSDGDYTPFVDDLAAAGADGFIFEPCVDSGLMVRRFGPSHCLVGSFVDCRDLASGDWARVEADIERTFAALAGCRGAIVAVGNHRAPNIPAVVLDRYFAKKNLRHSAPYLWAEARHGICFCGVGPWPDRLILAVGPRACQWESETKLKKV